MRRAGQTPHGARPNREEASGGPSGFAGMRAGSARHNLRVGRLSPAVMRGPEERPSCRQRQTEFGLQVWLLITKRTGQDFSNGSRDVACLSYDDLLLRPNRL